MVSQVLGLDRKCVTCAKMCQFLCHRCSACDLAGSMNILQIYIAIYWRDCICVQFGLWLNVCVWHHTKVSCKCICILDSACMGDKPGASNSIFVFVYLYIYICVIVFVCLFYEFVFLYCYLCICTFVVYLYLCICEFVNTFWIAVVCVCVTYRVLQRRCER